MEAPGSEDVAVSHLGADDLVIEADHLFRVTDSATKSAGTPGVGIEGQVLDSPRKSRLKNLDWRWAAITVDRVHRVIAIRESSSAPTNARDIIANEKVAGLSIHSSKYQIGMCATLCGHGPIANSVGHGAYNSSHNPWMGFGISADFRTRVIHIHNRPRRS